MADLITALPWIVVLLMFACMVLLLWQAYSIIGEQARLLVQLVAQFSFRAAAPVTAPAPLAPVPHVTAPDPQKLPPTVVPPNLVIDEGLVEFVKKQEAYAAKAYWDYKQYSIGYGTKANSPTEVIDEAEATRRLTVEINLAEQAVEKIAANAPKGVKQALTDLTYNAGSGWESQTLGQLIKEGKYEEAKSHVLQYNHAGGQVLSDLTARRTAEVGWFDHPL